jgi:hypothetical protein
MAYTYQVDFGAGWVTVVPVLGDAALKTTRDEAQFFARTTLDGQIKFTGVAADSLIALSATAQTAPFRILWDSVECYRGRLNLRTEADGLSSEFWCDVETVDGYETILKGADRPLNWLRNQEIYTCDVDYVERDILTFDTTAWRSNDIPILTTWQDNEVDIYARIQKTVPNAVAALLAGTPSGRLGVGGWYLVSAGATTSVIARSWQDAGYDKETFDKLLFVCESSISGQWALNATATFTSATCGNIVSGTLTGKICGLDYSTATGWTYYMMREEMYKAATFRHTRMRRLDETITGLVGQLDATIAVDTDTYTDFDDWYELLCSAVSDVKLVLQQSDVNPLSYSKTETSNRATLEEITWEKLWDLLGSSPYNFGWYLEDVAGTPTLRVRHISSMIKTTGSLSLKAYKDENWTVRATRYTWGGNYYSRIKRSVLAERIDFQGVDVVLSDVVGGEEQQVDLSGLFTDLLHIYHNPSEYPDNGMVLVAATVGSDADYECVNYPGVFSQEIETNEPLTISRLDDDSIASGDRPGRFSFTSAEVNGSTETVVEEKRRQVVPIYAPLRTPDEVDFGSLVPCDIADLEPLEVAIPLDGSKGGARFVGLF